MLYGEPETARFLAAVKRIRQQRVKLGAGESRGAFRSVELAVLFHFKPPVY